jgi:hypothetical protein
MVVVSQPDQFTIVASSAQGGCGDPFVGSRDGNLAMGSVRRRITAGQLGAEVHGRSDGVLVGSGQGGLYGYAGRAAC